MSQRWIKGFALVTGGLAGSTLAAVAVGNLLWKRATKNAVRRLGPVRVGSCGRCVLAGASGHFRVDCKDICRYGQDFS